MTFFGRFTALVLLVLSALAFSHADRATAHFIYTCTGYRYEARTGVHNLPGSEPCDRNPYTEPGVHQWATEQARLILLNDGYRRYANLLQAPIRIGHTGINRRHIDLLRDGVIAADTLLNGCTLYGRRVGWPLGDHMLNPYRHFGLRSYYLYPQLPGWHGWRYPRTDECARSPLVRSNSARMADEFFFRAQREWRAFQPGDAMFNLGIALHMVQDATVPSHVHPEMATRDYFPPASFFLLDAYPAWANAMRAQYPVNSGGTYGLPGSQNGVSIQNSAGGWVYWMATLAFPYTYYDIITSPVALSAMKCNVTASPEACIDDAIWLLRLTQRASAGFVRYFFGSVGYPPA
jgi:hypothetical protein